MKLIDLLIAEFEHETTTTRRHLERLPASHLEWRPHAKSFTLRALGSHIVECVGWADPIFAASELDFDPDVYVPFDAASVPALLDAYDDKVAVCTRALAAIAQADAQDGTDADTGVMAPWNLKIKGKLWFTRPKAVAFRDFTLNHLVHHRGQLTVYFRLLDVPVPGSYGPTADEA